MISFWSRPGTGSAKSSAISGTTKTRAPRQPRADSAKAKPAAISETRVLRTYLGGRQVYPR